MTYFCLSEAFDIRICDEY